MRSEPTRRVVRCMPGRQHPSRRVSHLQPERRGVQCELLAESGVRWPGVQAAGAVCTTKRRAGVLSRVFFARVSWLGRMHCSDSACYQNASVKAVRSKRACVGGHFPLLRSCGARTRAGLGCSRVHCAVPPTHPLVCYALKAVRSQPCARAVRAPPQPRAHAEPAHRAGSRRADAYCLPNCARHLDSVRRAPKQMAPFMWLRPQPWQTCASGH